MDALHTVYVRFPWLTVLNTVANSAASVDEVDISVKVTHWNGVERIVVSYDAGVDVDRTRAYDAIVQVF